MSSNVFATAAAARKACFFFFHLSTIKKSRKPLSFHSNPLLSFTGSNLPPQAQVGRVPFQEKGDPAASLTRRGVRHNAAGAACKSLFMDERAFVLRKKKKCSLHSSVHEFAWVRLKTPTHAEPCHRHMRVMDESYGLHNLWAACLWSAVLERITSSLAVCTLKTIHADGLTPEAIIWPGWAPFFIRTRSIGFLWKESISWD